MVIHTRVILGFYEQTYHISTTFSPLIDVFSEFLQKCVVVSTYFSSVCKPTCSQTPNSRAIKLGYIFKFRILKKYSSISLYFLGCMLQIDWRIRSMTHSSARTVKQGGTRDTYRSRESEKLKTRAVCTAYEICFLVNSRFPVQRHPKNRQHIVAKAWIDSLCVAYQL